jgi:UDP-N-acetylmuramate: L-alanyl-gamma-D-glutamyl-meso-diaminopimelate ligase
MNLENYYTQEKLKENDSKIRKIFFYRICGTGMGAAACLLKEKNYTVEGGDTNYYPPMSDYLETTGIPCHDLSSITSEKLKEFDLIVIGNVVPKTSDEARMLEELGVPFCSFPAALGAFVLNNVNVVGIAGTHGKTTTTYFFKQVFEKLGSDVGYFIGGVLNGKPPSKLGDGKYFFIESDEYDSGYFEKFSKFRSYCLNSLILTSLEFDHADIFSSIEDILDEFRVVMMTIDEKCIFNRDYGNVLKLYDEFQEIDNINDWQFYGENAPEGPRKIKMSESGSSFEMVLNDQEFQFETNIVGLHNLLNIATVIIYAFYEGNEIDKIKDAVKNLEMVKRRQEIRGQYKGAIVIDDFAHHPRAVELTIGGISTMYPNKKIISIIEPCSATARSSIFQEEFTKSLEKSAEVIIAKPQKPTSVKSLDDLDCDKIAKSLNNSGIKSSVAENLGELRSSIDLVAKEDSVLLIMSNGTCLDLWKSDFIKEFDSTGKGF